MWTETDRNIEESGDPRNSGPRTENADMRKYYRQVTEEGKRIRGGRRGR